jgi:hypothetical protein
MTAQPNSSARPALLQLRLSDESGLSFVELLVGISIAIGIAGLMGTFIFQFFSATRLGADQMAVAADIQTSSLWLTRDAAEASSFASGASPIYGSFSAAQLGPDRTYRYRYDALAGQLVREVWIGGALNSSNVVARNIEQEADVVFVESAGQKRVSVTLTATSADASLSQIFELALRVD